MVISFRSNLVDIKIPWISRLKIPSTYILPGPPSAAFLHCFVGGSSSSLLYNFLTKPNPCQQLRQREIDCNSAKACDKWGSSSRKYFIPCVQFFILYTFWGLDNDMDYLWTAESLRNWWAQ